MAVNGDEIRPEEPEEDYHNPNSYFKELEGIVAALDALAKAVTPEEYDDGTPPDELPVPCCNSYFASFRAIRDAIGRVKDAVDERNASPGGGAFALVSARPSSGRVWLQNLAVNDVTLDGGAVAFLFPYATDGRGRAFAIRLTMAAATEWSLPSGLAFESDDDGVFGEVAVGESAVFRFSEMTDGRFLVSRKTANAVVKE